MGSITRAFYQDDEPVRNTIEINGLGLKQNPGPQDVQLTQPVRGDGYPEIVQGFGPFKCVVVAHFYNSEQGNVSVRMKGEDGQWTAFVNVTG